MASENESGAAIATPQKEKPKRNPAPKLLPPYNVILLNDDEHSYEYVITMLRRLFGHPIELAFKMAKEVDAEGRVIIDTTTKERAEFKQEQVHAYGADALVKECAGSMTAVIEPCPG